MSASLPLPARLDLLAATPLAQEILSLRGAPLTLQADATTHLGTSCLQVLLAARHGWVCDGQALSLASPSEEMVQQLDLFGLAPCDLEATQGKH